jgi:hypothetical protein
MMMINNGGVSTHYSQIRLFTIKHDTVRFLVDIETNLVQANSTADQTYNYETRRAQGII